MTIFPLKKITIVAGRLLRERLLKRPRLEGATGHTMTAVEAAGSRGVHATDFEGRGVRIESIVSPAVAEAVLQRIVTEFLGNWAGIACTSDVKVLRRRTRSTRDETEQDSEGEQPETGN